MCICLQCFPLPFKEQFFKLVTASETTSYIKKNSVARISVGSDQNIIWKILISSNNCVYSYVYPDVFRKQNNNWGTTWNNNFTGKYSSISICWHSHSTGYEVIILVTYLFIYLIFIYSVNGPRGQIHLENNIMIITDYEWNHSQQTQEVHIANN